MFKLMCFGRIGMLQYYSVAVLLLLLGLVGCQWVVDRQSNDNEYATCSGVPAELGGKEFRSWIVQVKSLNDAKEINRKWFGVLSKRGFEYSVDDKVWMEGWFSAKVAREIQQDGYCVVEDINHNDIKHGEEITSRKFGLVGIDCPEEAPINNTFCGYSKSVSRCSATIQDELQSLSQNHTFIETINLGETHNSKPILGIRIGKLSDDVEDPFVSQVVVIAGQHGSSEMITTEIAMRLIRYYTNAFDDSEKSPEIHKLLQENVLTIVPVLNPDGYDYYFETGDKKRFNGRACPSEGLDGKDEGVDLNRNHEFAWNNGNAAAPGCGGNGRPGPAPNSEPETKGINALISNNVESTDADLSGNYKTAIVLNLHSGGNVVGFATGVDTNLTVCGLGYDGELTANCTPPDQEILSLLFGTQRPNRSFLKFEHPINRFTYDTGSLGRIFAYPMYGSLVDTLQSGEFSGTSNRVFAALVELTRNDCSGPLKMGQDQFSFIENDQKELVTHLLNAATSVNDNSYLQKMTGRSFSLPHIYRIHPDIEHPKARFSGSKDDNTISVSAPAGYVGMSENDITIDGVKLRTSYWKPLQSPYQFPETLTLCSKENPTCETSVIAGGPLDLCSSSGFDATKWSFINQQLNEPMEQCYWDLDIGPLNLGPQTATLTKHAVNLNMVDSKLVFSYRLGGNWNINPNGLSTQLYLRISDNGFQNCTWEEGTGCRVVEVYFDDYREARAGGDIGRFRTEIFDISDFDQTQNVQVQFEAVNVNSSRSARIYDLHIAGWSP